ncbi:MAG: sugar nucleotide-binding protein [Alistipes indistinctus]
MRQQPRRQQTAPGNVRYLFTDVAELDITDPQAVRRTMRENDVEVIVNCAAYTNVNKAEEDEATADLLNHRAVANLAAAARDRGATLIHISTDYVFGGDGNVPAARRSRKAAGRIRTHEASPGRRPSPKPAVTH